MQNSTALSVTEVEVVAGVECAQQMLFEKNVIKSMGLKVKLPMILWMDNEGMVDLFNNWSITGCM